MEYRNLKIVVNDQSTAFWAQSPCQKRTRNLLQYRTRLYREPKPFVMGLIIIQLYHEEPSNGQ